MPFVVLKSGYDVDITDGLTIDIERPISPHVSVVIVFIETDYRTTIRVWASEDGDNWFMIDWRKDTYVYQQAFLFTGKHMRIELGAVSGAKANYLIVGGSLS